jgi:hypothetical protein
MESRSSGGTNSPGGIEGLLAKIQARPIPWIVGGIIAGACLIFVIILFTTFNSVQKDGVDKETQLNASYLSAQNELGTLVSSVKEQMGVANVKSEQLNKVLSDAVKGRYEEGSKAVGATGGGQLISALVEAYPSLEGLNSYDRVIDAISSGREAYKNKQNVLLDQLRAYDKWRNEGIIHSVVVDIVGYPSDGLEARIGNKVVTGEAARNQMYVIVLPTVAKEAYETGTFEGIEIEGPESQK